MRDEHETPSKAAQPVLTLSKGEEPTTLYAFGLEQPSPTPHNNTPNQACLSSPSVPGPGGSVGGQTKAAWFSKAVGCFVCMSSPNQKKQLVTYQRVNQVSPPTPELSKFFHCAPLMYLSG